MGVVGFLALSCTTLPACLRVTEGLWYKMATPLSLIHINLPKGGATWMKCACFFSPLAFFRMASKLFSKGPLKNKLSPSWKHIAVVRSWWKIQKRPHDLCAMWFPVQLQREQKKKWLAPQHCIVHCFDKQAFSLQMKEMCHLFQNPPSFHHFVCPSVLAFVSPTPPLKSFFEGAEGVIVSFRVCLSSRLFPFIHSIQNLETGFCSHKISE